MIIVWGRHLYGKVDAVGDLLYVKTAFFHLYGIPLFPTQSWIILAGSEHDDIFEGVAIRPYRRSFLLVWLRNFLVLTLMVTFVFGCVKMDDRAHHRPASLPVIVVNFIAAIGSAVLLVASLWFYKQANFLRAVELGALMDISWETIAAFYPEAPAHDPNADPLSDEAVDDNADAGSGSAKGASSDQFTADS